MKITIMTADEQIITLDVDRDETVENLKALLEVETQVPLQQQQLLYNGKEIRNAEKLSGLGVSDGDLVMMVAGVSQSSASTSAMGFNPDGSAVNPSAFQQHLRNDSNLMAKLFQSDPELAQIVLGNDLNKLQEILRLRHKQRAELLRRKDEEMALLYADPFDVEAQKKIEEAIRQKSIDENWEAAIEHNPEAFARVVMLYVDMEVNSVPLKAFVDSGAQSTIISKSCAERCGLLRLLDTRYRGIARGVGQSEILGRIHVAPIKIGSVFYPCSFLVLDSPNMEFLFGLDMLRKHQCMIDLKENVLRVGGGEVAVPFLHEKDIPSRLLDEERHAKEASVSDAQETLGSKGKSNTPTGGPSGRSSQSLSEGTNFEAKVTKLVELGFGRAAVIQALKFFDGNEEQAAAYLFGG
ncbi:PREDICTED: DNA damage-inducible protein 1-like isoform X1 [Ipomoea nil]|uniref:DNA damage-inducible protein 1-like isoform X1 n=1 Tax=Ipomoea nil TaxID=35883 RepID=UPI000900E813|nr:PREDICTED: DNA damage-inducible protein 1-like isoform X1 [Ipomoea nil]